jgi:protein tyrosine phosphatase (PTP) superfamily phosphohydrolase (DUF442 family)
LKPQDLRYLSERGVKSVINLALDDHPEALCDEATLLAEKGIEYVHIPVPFDAPTDEHLQEFKTALKQSAPLTHVHCIMNYRVTAFFYMLDRENGLSHEAALGRMRKVWDPFSSDHAQVKPWREFMVSAQS